MFANLSVGACMILSEWRPALLERRMSRIPVLIGVVAVIGLVAQGATEVRELKWTDLLPPGQLAPPQVVDHTRIPTFDDFPYNAVAETVPELEGQVVKLPGFVVPLDVAGDLVVSFLLVPYFGACIHQPPPPPNQIVYVEFAKPVELTSMYDPVWVTGTLGLDGHFSNLAHAGYSMQGQAVEKYRY